MAFLPLANAPEPLALFAQTSLTPIGTGGTFARVSNEPEPLPAFSVSTPTTVPAGGSFIPIPPLPVASTAGGSYGFPV